MNLQQMTTRSSQCLLGLLGLTLFACPALAQVNGPGPSQASTFDTVLNLPGDEAVITGFILESVGDVPGQTTQLNVSDGGTIGGLFDAGAGSEVNISGGTVGSFFDAQSGSEVNISGGTFGSIFEVESGSVVNISGGRLSSRLFAVAGSEVNFFGQIFLIDGVELNALQLGQAFTIADRDVTISGVLEDGEEFSFDFFSELDPFDDVGPNDLLETNATLTVTIVSPLPVILGDVSLNGVVDFSDVAPFIAVLKSGVYQVRADTDEDGDVDFSDIPAFIAILSGQ